ncbi:esterase/lipase superfamily enzyme [Pseudochelatococcus lubricantis]|uniref:Esterase/lipase superfamily enzyme n=1 Tax=Pseudochelatococcus lubricantis TaxID=1538102 RepID=A0ABX0V6X0_9HYPH|nr:alpha/beta fold hydrolase [Pseudochelatococcus lubricantis]NIJ60260.1 esterase/lipase superfamily enzyme [Pseudochelatococcus lubricantis]
MPNFRGSILLIMLACLLAACAGRPGPELLNETTASAPGAKVVTVYVATTRQRDQDGRFTSDRSRALNYARFRISIPPEHKPGNIEWPTSTPDPQKNFVTVEQRQLDRATFQSEVSRSRGGKPPGLGVFVHGYNTNFTEAVFRIAQMAADANVDAVPILFAWPSEGSVGGYVSDKEAVTFSRDQLAALLTMLAAKRTQGPIAVVGHSMGGWLTTEAVRQLRIGGKDAVIRRLQVILAAPDIDVDVFGSQVAAIGPLDPPMTVLVSHDDVALKVSELLATSRQRVGRLDVTDPRVEEATRKANVQIVDISAVKTSDSFKHDRFVALAAYYPKFSETGADNSGAGLRQAGAFVFNTVGATLSSPFLLAGKIMEGP